MRQTRLIALAAACATIAVAMTFAHHVVHGQSQPPATIYNPYPTGILPSNITPEIARVLREVDSIEAEAITQWHAIPPPVVTGNPPTLQNTGVALTEILGKLMNFDKTISPFNDEACSSCHMPYAAYSGPIPSVNLTMIAYPGSVHFRANKRTAQRYTYASYFPPLQYDAVQGLFFGGNFWDSRATGYLLRSPDAEQAQGPPVDPGEMGNPDTACITYKLSLAPYRPLFEQVWGAGSFDITWPANTAQICATPNGASVFNGNPTPVALSPGDRILSNNDYDHWAQSLNAFEHSESVSPFTSKFDAFLAGTYTMTANEAAGYALFNGRGNCNSCHLDGRSTAPSPSVKHGGSGTGGKDTGTTADVTPYFTCFGSANEGLPKNPRVAFYYETTPDFFGFTPNPGGFTYTDFGLGTFLRSGFGSAPNPNSSWRQFASTVDGQMQVMTARNVALTPPSCPTTEAPGPYFQKEFFHNGYIKSLKQLVHFYNTRDLYRNAVESGNCPAGTTEKVNCWPEPEVPQNIDMTTGNLGLTDVEEDQIVAFLQTLSDGFTTPYPDINTYTGACMTGGTAATQGNSTIIPADLLRQFQQMQR
jgi:cytochrome c peroxidase